jgi:predicted RNA binding protein YcfA (HicA-like mRNA interferase family)
LILIHPVTKSRTVIPVHSGQTIKGPLLRAIIRDANLTVGQFHELL